MKQSRAEIIEIRREAVASFFERQAQSPSPFLRGFPLTKTVATLASEDVPYLQGLLKTKDAHIADLEEQNRKLREGGRRRAEGWGRLVPERRGQ